MSSSSSWPIIVGLIALALGAVWYDANNATAHTGDGNASAASQVAAVAK